MQAAGHHENANTPTTQQVGEEGEENIDFRFKRGRDRASDVRTAVLTVAVLFIAATYQAVINPPGGLWQDDGDKAQTTYPVEKVSGVSILATRNKTLFSLFMAGNTLGFLCSMGIIYSLTRGFARQVELNVAIFTISFSYGMCAVVITPHEYKNFMLAGYFVVYFIYICVAVVSQCK